MEKIYGSVSELIGNTPTVKLGGIKRAFGLSADIFAKVEGANPMGSAKDRVAYRMILDAEASGELKKGSVIIEPTSGNTGIGLAAIGRARGYRVIIVMPDTMSRERQTLMRAYGAELVLTDGRLGMAESIRRAQEMCLEIPNAYMPDQFSNPSNPKAHYLTTGPEIWADTDGAVDIFVAGVGTGGTVTGVGKYLKEKNCAVKIVGVEPSSSAVLSGEAAGAHGIQGIGAGFIPKILDRDVIDSVMKITEEESYAAARSLASLDGILAGISGGAALSAAIKLASLPENEGKKIVVLLPDGGEKYLSTPLFSE